MLSVVLLSLLTLSVTWGCPSKEDLFPCTCDQPNDSAFVTCSGLDNDQDLVNAAGSLVDRKYVYSMLIENCIFQYIPSDAFKGTKFVELEIKDTSLMALTDTDIAFEGLEDHLEIFMMTDCTLMNDWDWSIFRNLKNLMILDIIRGNLQSIEEDLDFLNTTTVKNIGFDNNQISYLHDKAFAKFENLIFLSLSNNMIVEVKRSMIPNPATELKILDLSYNLIEEFPEDMFTNMLRLETLSITSNKILVLKEQTFTPIWSQLEAFAAMGNELGCDCRMSWILKAQPPRDVRAVCAKPPDVKGKNLRHLTSKDLWCYYGHRLIVRTI